MEKMNRRVNLYMNDAMYAALRQQARAQATDMSQVARMALDSHLRREFKKRKVAYPGQQSIDYEAAAEGVPANE